MCVSQLGGDTNTGADGVTLIVILSIILSVVLSVILSVILIVALAGETVATRRLSPQAPRCVFEVLLQVATLRRRP